MRPHLPVLRRRLRGGGRRPGECGGGPGPPGQCRPALLQGFGSRETLGLKGRLLAPTIGSRTTGWNEALDLVAERFAETIERHGPDAVAFYVSGQLLTEDYVANKLMKGFIGSGSIDTNSRLCMASSVAGHRRAFGEDLVPGCYEDLDEADLVVLVGSNTAWCHPILFRRLLDARQKRGTRLVVVDPRRTATAARPICTSPSIRGRTFSSSTACSPSFMRRIGSIRSSSPNARPASKRLSTSPRPRRRTSRRWPAAVACARPMLRPSTSGSPPRRAP